MCIPYVYASFGTFCVQIGQLFAAQWVFKHSEEFRNRRHFPSIAAICQLWKILQGLTVPRIIDKFGRKRCQKKRKDVDHTLQKKFIEKYFVVHEQSAIINSFSTYVFYAPDGLFWLNLYVVYTDSTKINRPGHNIRMYWTIFWHPTVHVKQNIFEKTLLEVVVHIFTLLLYMNSRLSKIRSVHTYAMTRTVYFGWICTTV